MPRSHDADDPFGTHHSRGCFPCLRQGKVLAMAKDDRRLYVCPMCGGAQTVTEWKAADVEGEPEVQVTDLCPTCDGAGQVLGPAM